MDPDSTDEMVDHLVDFFDQVAPDYDGWAQGQHGRVAARNLFFQGLAPLARRHYLSLPRFSSERARFGEPSVLPELLSEAGFEVTTMTEMVTGGRTRSAREWTELMAGAGPLPYTLIKSLGPRYRAELEQEVDLAMDSLGDPDDAFRYHHSYLLAVAEKR